MASYYHIRILSTAGVRYEAETVFTLAKAVKRLQQLAGVQAQVPYQIIHRALKNGFSWSESVTLSHYASPRCILVIEEAAGQPPTSDVQANLAWWEQNPQHPARRAARAVERDELARQPVPAAAELQGLVEMDLPCVMWSDADWKLYASGVTPSYFVRAVVAQPAGPDSEIVLL